MEPRFCFKGMHHCLDIRLLLGARTFCDTEGNQQPACVAWAPNSGRGGWLSAGRWRYLCLVLLSSPYRHRIVTEAQM